MKPATLMVSAAALATAYALKAFYSHAGADALAWILGPSCWLAAKLGGLELVWEEGSGWISHAQALVVGPACAGVNYIIVCFGTLFFSFHPRFSRARDKSKWLVMSLIVAYFTGILANTVRIVIASHLYALALPPGWLTPERLHRLAGAVIYCAMLLLTHAAAESRFVVGGLGGRLWPFVWYLGVALLVPILNRSYGEKFIEHALMVSGVALLALLVYVLPRAISARVST